MPNNQFESSENKRIYIFRFNGGAEISYKMSQYDGERMSLSSDFSRDTSLIQQEISSIIKTSLPSEIGEVSVNTKIEFYDGSLEWIGEVVLVIFATMNVLSAISGTVDFFEKLSKVIEVAVQIPITRAAKRRNINFQVGSIRNQVVAPISILRNQDDQSSMLEHIVRQQDIQSRHLQEISQRQTLIIDHFIRKNKKEEGNISIYILGLIPWLVIIALIYLLLK